MIILMRDTDNLVEAKFRMCDNKPMWDGFLTCQENSMMTKQHRKLLGMSSSNL